MKLTFLIIFCLLVASHGFKSNKNSFTTIIKFIFKLLKFLFFAKKGISSNQIIPYSGIPKFIIESSKNDTPKGVTTWPLDYFLVKDSLPKNILKLILTMLIFKKVFVFIGLLVLMFLVPAVLTTSDKKEEEEMRKFDGNSINLKELERIFEMFEKSLDKFSHKKLY